MIHDITAIHQRDPVLFGKTQLQEETAASLREGPSDKARSNLGSSGKEGFLQQCSSASLELKEIPVGSRIIENNGKFLAVLPEALKKMEQFDTLVRKRDYFVEMMGFGITKQINQCTTLVVDFVTPSPDKIFYVDGLFIDNNTSALAKSVIASNKLTMKLSEDEVVVESDINGYSFKIDKYVWEPSSKYFNKLTNIKLPHNYDNLIEVLKDQEVSLNTDFDVAAHCTTLVFTPRFFDRVDEVAEQQGAEVKFSMHYHPYINLAVRALQNKPLAEVEKYYNELLQYSDSDINAARELGLDWFEIRSFGTPEDITAYQDTTSRYYYVPNL